MMMNIERRHGKEKAVIKKALVELDGKPFQAFAQKRASWAAEDDFQYPGPIQYFGPASVCDRPTERHFALNAPEPLIFRQDRNVERGAFNNPIPLDLRS